MHALKPESIRQSTPHQCVVQCVGLIEMDSLCCIVSYMNIEVMVTSTKNPFLCAGDFFKEHNQKSSQLLAVAVSNQLARN